MAEKLIPKRDKYQKSRGQPQFLEIYCAQCQVLVLVYQKDGPGQLKRLYLDRIFAPKELAELQNSVGSIDEMRKLSCPNGHVLAFPMVYKPENRLAYSLVSGSFGKKKSRNK